MKMEVVYLKNIMKLVAIILFVGLLIFAYFYFQKEEVSQKDMGREAAMDEIDYDAYIDSLAEPLDTRLTYDKEMLFVYVSEMNNTALHYFPLGDLVEDEVSFNEETQSIYFYNEQLAPYESAEMLILSEVYNLDVMLSQDVDSVSVDSSRLNIRDISFNEIEEELQPVNNEQRLFLNETLKVERVENTDNLRVIFMEEEHILKPDEYQDFIVEKGDAKSRILVRNFGPWETINMKYQIKE